MLRPMFEDADAVVSRVGPRGPKDGPAASGATRATEANSVRSFAAAILNISLRPAQLAVRMYY